MAQHGRGKQLYREFVKTVNQLVRTSKQANKKGEGYTFVDFSSELSSIYDDFKDRLDALDIDTADVWDARMSKVIDDTLSDMLELLPAGQELDTNEEQENEEFESEDCLEIQGYIICEITEDHCTEETSGLPGTGKGIVRGQYYTTFKELREYFSDIPPEVIKGIVPAFENNKKVGWYPCIISDTQ